MALFDLFNNFIMKWYIIIRKYYNTVLDHKRWYDYHLEAKLLYAEVWCAFYATKNIKIVDQFTAKHLVNSFW